MYSVVLMVAISGGAEAPDFGGRGCSGCNGGLFSRGCSGCSGSCHGGGLFSRGCHGGCHGGGLFNRGCHGCSGACHGSSACHGCNGGCRGGLFGGLFHRRGCHGCTGACHGAVACTGGCTGGTVIEEKKKEMPKGGEKKTSAEVPATIVVTLPENARLTIDGNATTSTSTRRTFTTPALDVNSEYVYTLRAEVMVEGRPVVETQTVTVRGGMTATVPFNFPAAVASR